MAISLKERKASTLILVCIIGILIGSYLNSLIGLLPGGDNVVKTFFTYSFINFGVGYPNPILIDIDAVKFHFGFQMKFSLLSVLGVLLGLYFFRWYK